MARSRLVEEEGHHGKRYRPSRGIHGHWRLPAYDDRSVDAGSDRGPKHRTAPRSRGIHRLERRPAGPAAAYQAHGPAACRSWRLVFEWRADSASLGEPEAGGAT